MALLRSSAGSSAQTRASHHVDLATRALLLVSLASCAIGCAMMDGWFVADSAGLVFSHRLHVEEEGLDCLSCHEDASVSADPGMPTFDGCDVCHFDMDEERDPELRVASLFDDADNFLARRVAALDDEVRFDHLAHVQAINECGACHTNIESTERISADELAVDMDACMACHDRMAQPNECAVCHTVIDEDWEPDSHRDNWTRRHGPICRRNATATVDRCEICHQESSCIQCHMIEAPQNHNTSFRRRTHGILARADRDNCAACHDSASCDRCHDEVLPITHTALFGGTKSTHCLSCHFPLESSGCSTCHVATPSHALGTPKPAWHTPTMNCRSCHGATLPLSHVDNGSNCNICHP